MALTKLTKHDNCEVKAELLQTGPHYARLVCTDCDVHIQWLTWWDYIKIQQLLGAENKGTYYYQRRGWAKPQYQKGDLRKAYKALQRD